MRLPYLTPLASLLVLACADDNAADTTETTSTETAGQACEIPANATPAAAVPIRVTNERDVAIYVLPYSSFGCNYGKVEIELGGEPVLWHHANTYAYDCSKELCGWGCSDGGAMGWIINPGATAELEWSGGVWLDTPLPQACKDELDCPNEPGDTCSALDLVVDGSEYLARINLSETCPDDSECMACTEGVCEVFFYEPMVGPETESFEASAAFPAGVDIVVE